LRSISLAEFDNVERLEPQDFYIVTQPGLTLQNLQEILNSRGLKFPFLTSYSPGTVGGMTASGQLFDGTSWYDISRWVLAVEVFLADGSISRSGAVTYKSVAGYDLTRLFCASFGTLGIITEVSLRLYPASAQVFGKNLSPVKQRIPKMLPLAEAPVPKSTTEKMSYRLKQVLDPRGQFPIITGWNDPRV
jgi:FAD/FMN-containing dehydrogenase